MVEAKPIDDIYATLIVKKSLTLMSYLNKIEMNEGLTRFLRV